MQFIVIVDFLYYQFPSPYEMLWIQQALIKMWHVWIIWNLRRNSKAFWWSCQWKVIMLTINWRSIIALWIHSKLLIRIILKQISALMILDDQHVFLTTYKAQWNQIFIGVNNSYCSSKLVSSLWRFLQF